MRADALGSQRDAGLGCRMNVFPYDVFNGIAAEPFTSDGREDGRIAIASAFLEPLLEGSGSVPPQRRAALLSSLALATDMRAGSQHDIATIEIDQFGDAQAGLQGEQQDRPIAAANPGRWIRCCKQRLHLGSIDEVNRSPHIALVRHGEDALAVQCMLRFAHRNVAAERTNRG